MLNDNTIPKSPFGKNRMPKLPNVPWQSYWKLLSDEEKLFIITILNKNSIEYGSPFIISKNDPFSIEEKKFIINKFHAINEEDDKDSNQKQNMSLEGFTTTKDLDLQLESILRSIEPEVMKSLKSSNYFNKQE